MTAITIAPRFNGPDGSGNGGYSAGALAATYAPEDGKAVEVTLRRPPPLGVSLTVSDGTVTFEGHDVLTSTLVDDDISPVDPVAYDDALAAATTYPEQAEHPFPRCFGCGPARAEGDGLRIFAGKIGDDRSAAVWVPTDDDAPVVWAALDCPGAWAVSGFEGRPMVLGRMACVVEAAPRIGEPHVVVGAHLGTDGRKSFTAATLYDSDGRIVARARHTWIQIDPATFGQAERS